MQQPPHGQRFSARPRRTFWQWYSAQTRFVKIALPCIALFVASAACNGIVTGTSTQPTATPAISTPTQAVVLAATVTVAPKPKPTTPPPTPTPKPQPTQPKPTPTSSCQAVNNNPWCYNFSPGNLIYTPPSGFCGYFNCIPTFYGSDDPGDGFIIECSDGTYSQSGGESGACSYHGGEMRPLYSH